MPMYLYALVLPDGRVGDTFEVEQRLTDPALTAHPETGQPVRRILGDAHWVSHNQTARSGEEVKPATNPPSQGRYRGPIAVSTDQQGGFPLDETDNILRLRSYREYDLASARLALADSDRKGTKRKPAPFQNQALDKLDRWYRSSTVYRGGILVLPTGGGKTFTAIQFICGNPLSEGFKVLWLAHTHHLLSQAFHGFEHPVGDISEPRSQLNVRTVSGAPGDSKVRDIQPTDDVVIGSLQTISNAFNNKHANIEAFVSAARGNLFVVFDEAHHSPAPSYRKLILGLQKRCPNLAILGLTATPTYGDVKKRGWLQQLFPSGIIHEVSPQTLMAARVLARPVFEEAETTFEAVFDAREYDRWIRTNKDLPEDIVGALANSRERNERIVNQYVANRKRYGKTIIFADRWAQCLFLTEALQKRGVRAGAIFSQTDPNPGTVEARHRRTTSENQKILDDFRAKKLDVLVNIRMATEGTDIPDVQSVFLTRQTTSRILLTQMIGRALRGPLFEGTEEAFIVSFIDKWDHRINFAVYEELAPGLADDSLPKYGERPPIQLISIDLVRRLSRQMDSGVNVNPGPYRSFLPVGWYRVEYNAAVEGTDDDESFTELVMVFDGEKSSFDHLINSLQRESLDVFQEPTIRLADVEDRVTAWSQKFFSKVADRLGGLIRDVFSIARHIAQGDNQPPSFFPFKVRDDHDLDAVARRFVNDNLTQREAHEALKAEFDRKDRYWQSLYHTFQRFKFHYAACVDRELDTTRHRADSSVHRSTFRTPEPIRAAEPSEEVKESVKARDRYECVCCGNNNRRSLQVDHIASSYHGGSNHLDNLQTLCSTCNGAKKIEMINFRTNQTTLTHAPTQLLTGNPPSGEDAREAACWVIYIRRAVNFFFQCASVRSVEIGARGERFYHWCVKLFPGNNPAWLEPHLGKLVVEIHQARKGAGLSAAPEDIIVTN